MFCERPSSSLTEYDSDMEDQDAEADQEDQVPWEMKIDDEYDSDIDGKTWIM